MAVHLDQIVPWGRSGKEYELMFALTAGDLRRGMLDCGGGPSSFTAEASGRGHRVVAVDPIYAYSSAEIQGRFEATVDTVMAQVLMTPGDWTWSYHRDPMDLLANRRAALERFLADYEGGRRERRYVQGSCLRCPSPPARSEWRFARICCFYTQTCSLKTFISVRCWSCAAWPTQCVYSHC